MTIKLVPKEETERNKKIYELSCVPGNTYRGIAISYDITEQRVGQIIKKQKAKLLKEKLNQP